jgi:Coenzyme PQQ synthesis protein D (PqqD)
LSEVAIDKQYVLRRDQGAAFFLMNDQKVLFSESTQEMYVLNDLAAYIWCRLEEKQKVSEICADLVKSGVSGDDAKKYVNEAVWHWLKFGLLRLEHECTGSSTSCPAMHSLNVDIGGLRVTLNVANERLMQLFGPVFEHLPSSAEEPHCILEINEMEGMTLIFENRATVICCRVNEAVPLIKAYITERICRLDATRVVFHAATLIHNNKALLISGAPGAGKSTLSTRLLEEGFEYAGDDIALIGLDGEVRGVPFALTLKRDSWKLVSHFRPELESLAIHDRPDQLKVRFLVPQRIASRETSAASWIIFIRRTPFGPSALEPLSRTEVMGRFIKSSYSPGGKLTLASCAALRRTIAGAISFELTYSNLEGARDKIMDLCCA